MRRTGHCEVAGRGSSGATGKKAERHRVSETHKQARGVVCGAVGVERFLDGRKKTGRFERGVTKKGCN